MANFCTKCGNPIQFCTCQATAQPQAQAHPQQQTYNQDFSATNPSFNPYGYNPAPASQPNPQAAPKGAPSAGKPKSGSGSVVNINLGSDAFVPIKNFFGFGESEMIDNSDPYEKGKKIVPDLVSPCEGEIPVKQYEIGKCRARLRLQWSEARMQVTNKRVLFRVSGRSVIGKDVANHDYKIDEISGINFTKGVQFSLLTFVIGWWLMILSAGVGWLLGSIPIIGYAVPYIFTLAAIAMPFAVKFFLHKKLHILCAMMATMAIGSAFSYQVFDSGEESLFIVAAIISVICGIIALWQLIKFSLKPSASIEIITKDAGKSVFGLYSGRIFKGNIGLDEIVPAKDTDEAFKEMSAIISDIQQLGDYGVQKWKQ